MPAPKAPHTAELWSAYAPPRSLAEKWELSPETKEGVFRIKLHEPIYVLPLSWRQHVNINPCSPNPDNCAPGYGKGYMNTEAKFQISGKVKAAENLFNSPLDLWLGYTQQSHWQVYDATDSRPFRDTNYQPEAWLTLPMNWGSQGLRWRMFNLGVVHQSNGESNPLSRSWNRIYATFGLQAGDLSLLIKPWIRLKESPADDNNPDISDYMGRMELQAIYPWGQHVFSAKLSNNLRFNASTPNRSLIRGEWAFPLYGDLHGYVQAHYGWGESMLNYNFRNAGIGLGVSLVQWR
ncbi:phospholipase A [Paucibacter sp. AS339]|uniref:phospholipase A n=1 Tax=Paucibacter hankyongi TaxID=3133434 RepID=UPI0030B6EE08